MLKGSCILITQLPNIYHRKYRNTNVQLLCQTPTRDHDLTFSRWSVACFHVYVYIFHNLMRTAGKNRKRPKYVKTH